MNMEENDINLEIDIDLPKLKGPLSLKGKQGFFEKQRVERINERDFFLSDLKDFNRFTFFHPGDPDPVQTTSPPVLPDFETLNPDVSSSLQKFSNLLHKIPAIEAVTDVIESSSSTPIPESVTHDVISFHENVTNVTSLGFSNSSISDWSSEEIGAVLIVCLMVPFIICSNLFVIASVIKFRRLHTPTNYFITSLAAVDIVVALATPLAIAVQLFQYGDGDATHDTVLCLLPNRILMMACGVSLLILATIAYDRHTALICPLEYVNIMTSRKVVIMMAVSWFYSAAVVWFPIAAGWYDVMTSSVRCSTDNLHTEVHILFFVALFVPSCTVIMICYSRIFLVARHHAKAIAAVEFAVHRRLQVRFMIKDTKYAKTLAIVIGAFLLLWLPHLIYTLVKTFSDSSVNVWLETYLILLAVFNSGINPWIYAFKNNEFRAAFRRMAKEYCGAKLFKIDDRRGSLMSGVSITPRLSRTDSRMVSTILDPTTDFHRKGKICHSLDSLDNYEVEVDTTKCKLGDSEVEEKSSNSNALPTFSLVNDKCENGTQVKGHINWGHYHEEELVPQTKDIGNSGLFSKSTSGTTVSRNQSFTLGINHICSSRECQKICNDPFCSCKYSKSIPGNKLTRSSSSVTPSTTMSPYFENRYRRALIPVIMDLQISGLSSVASTLPTPPGVSKTNPSHQSSFSSLPSSSPSTYTPNRTRRSPEIYQTRPRPSRGQCNLLHANETASHCVGTPGSTTTSNNTILSENSNSFTHQIVSNTSNNTHRVIANHERHLTEGNVIFNPIESSSNSCSSPTSGCLTPTHSCPTLIPTLTGPANFNQQSAESGKDANVRLSGGQASATDTSGLPS